MKSLLSEVHTVFYPDPLTFGEFEILGRGGRIYSLNTTLLSAGFGGNFPQVRESHLLNRLGETFVKYLH